MVEEGKNREWVSVVKEMVPDLEEVWFLREWVKLVKVEVGRYVKAEEMEREDVRERVNRVLDGKVKESGCRMVWSGVAMYQGRLGELIEFGRSKGVKDKMEKKVKE